MTYLAFSKLLIPPISKRFVENIEKYKGKKIEMCGGRTDSYRSYIYFAFTWCGTPEDGNYWMDIHDNINKYIIDGEQHVPNAS